MKKYSYVRYVQTFNDKDDAERTLLYYRNIHEGCEIRQEEVRTFFNKEKTGYILEFVAEDHRQEHEGIPD